MQSSSEQQQLFDLREIEVQPISLDNENKIETSTSEIEFEIAKSDPTQQIKPSEVEDLAKEQASFSKTKILASLAIVVLATWLAHWVQQPADFIKADVLNDSLSSNSNLIAQSIPQETIIEISLFGFEPTNINIKAGEKIKWINSSSEAQTIIGKEVGTAEGVNFESPVLKTGDTFEFEFPVESTFEFYSTYNPSLIGKITVGSGIVPTATTSNSVINTTSSAQDTTSTSQPEEINGTFLNPDLIASTSTSPPDSIPTTTSTTSNENFGVRGAAPAESSPTSTESLSAYPDTMTKSGPAEILLFVTSAASLFLGKKLTGSKFKN